MSVEQGCDGGVSFVAEGLVQHLVFQVIANRCLSRRILYLCIIIFKVFKRMDSNVQSKVMFILTQLASPRFELKLNCFTTTTRLKSY